MTFDDVIEWTLNEEGGFVDRADDPGGATNWGQTIPWLTDLYGRPVTRDEVKALTREQAVANYRAFAHRWQLDTIWQHAPRTAAAVFDFGVNSGIMNAVRAMQRAVDTTPDGVIGSATLTAVARADDSNVATEVLASRLEVYARLARSRPTVITGWLLRLARQLRRLW